MRIMVICFLLLSSEVGRYFAPLAGFPLNDGVAEIMGAQPGLGAKDNLIERLRFRGTL